MTINATGNRMSAEIARQSRLAGDIARTQISISTGRRIQIASDDPLAAATVARIERAQSDGATWRGNLAMAASLSAQADGVLAALSSHMVQARELALAGASGTATAADRATLATGLRAIATDVAALRTTGTPYGEPLFSTQTARAMRFDATTVFAPVDDAAAVFDAGGVPLTQVLTDAAAALDSGDRAQISAMLDRLTGAIDHVADAAAGQGLRAARIDSIDERNAAETIDQAAHRSSLEDTDFTAAIARLNAQQLTLDAAQAAFARINRRSLFDILG